MCSAVERHVADVKLAHLTGKPKDLMYVNLCNPCQRLAYDFRWTCNAGRVCTRKYLPSKKLTLPKKIIFSVSLQMNNNSNYIFIFNLHIPV